jgi:hypothetical protein
VRVALKYRDGVARFGKLRRHGHAGWARANYGHRFTGFEHRRGGLHVAFLKGDFNNVLLDFLNGHRRAVDAQHAG